MSILLILVQRIFSIFLKDLYANPENTSYTRVKRCEALRDLIVRDAFGNLAPMGKDTKARKFQIEVFRQ